MGLPSNPLGIIGVSFGRIWGPSAASAHLVSDVSSTASKSIAAATERSAGADPAETGHSEGSALPMRLLKATYRMTGRFISRLQAARMRAVRREVEVIRRRLHRWESSDEGRSGAPFSRYY